VRLLTVVAVGSVFATAAHPGWRVASAHGVTIRYPPGWYATKRPLTPVAWPTQILALASFRFPAQTRPNGCRPQGTLERMPADGAFLYVIDYGSRVLRPSVFGPRPRTPRLTNFGNYECMGPSYLLRFRDAGRYFQVSVALGPRADRGLRATVRDILASFRARPR
jgi:hypothetical protein